MVSLRNEQFRLASVVTCVKPTRNRRQGESEKVSGLRYCITQPSFHVGKRVSYGKAKGGRYALKNHSARKRKNPQSFVRKALRSLRKRPHIVAGFFFAPLRVSAGLWSVVLVALGNRMFRGRWPRCDYHIPVRNIRFILVALPA